MLKVKFLYNFYQVYYFYIKKKHSCQNYQFIIIIFILKLPVVNACAM